MPLLDAVARRAIRDSAADLSLAHLASAGPVILGPAGEQIVILRDSTMAATLRCQGSRVAKAPVNLTVLSRLTSPDDNAKAATVLADLLLRHRRDIDCTRGRLLLRDALAALDGKCLGASYRDIATVIYGAERVRPVWSSRSRWMKDRMCRALARGEELRDGGYRELLEPGCRFR